MKITTLAGVGEGVPQTDLMEYNKRLERLTKILKIGIIVGGSIGFGFLLLSIFVLYQIMVDDILTHSLRILAG